MKLEDQIKEWTTVQVGEIILTSYGSYSDYCISAMYRALRDFDANEMFSEFRKSHPRTTSIFSFFEWAESCKYVEELTYREFWGGD